MTIKLTREFYVMTGSTPVADDQSDAIAYLYNERSGRPCVQLFSGKKAKSDFHFHFKTEQERAERIDLHFRRRREALAFRAAQAAERKKPHTLKVGDILVCSWGWEQTNVDFYQITATTPGGVSFRKIAARDTESNGHDAGRCTAVKDSFIEKAETHTRRASADNSVKMNSYSNAYLWDGKDRYWSSYA